jgi:hypothetical protein
MKGGLENMGVDRVQEWKRFSEHMEKYIRERTIEEYGFQKSEKGSIDLMSFSKPVICVWNILRYSLRMWNEKGKEHDLEKIAHYAQLAWGMRGGEAKKE